MIIIQYFICSLILIINFLFNQFKHPLNLGLILLTQTFLVCLIAGVNSKSFWFSYILFLIFIGGLLILFIYVISLISNEKFKSVKFKLSKVIFVFFLISLLIIILYFFNYKFNLQRNDLTNTCNIKPTLYENSINLNKLYNFPTNLINLLLINYLFLILIITVKITKFFHGPLRIKN